MRKLLHATRAQQLVVHIVAVWRWIVGIVVEPAYVPSVVGQRQHLGLDLISPGDVGERQVLTRIGGPLCPGSRGENDRGHKETNDVFHKFSCSGIAIKTGGAPRPL